MISLSPVEQRKARTVFAQMATRCVHHGLYGATLDERTKRLTNKLGRMIIPTTTKASLNPIRL